MLFAAIYPEKIGGAFAELRRWGIVGNFITDMFGEELKPWQDEENQVKEQ